MQLLQLPECKDFVALAFEKAAMLPAEEYQEFLGMVKATLQAARGNYDILGLPTKPATDVPDLGPDTELSHSWGQALAKPG